GKESFLPSSADSNRHRLEALIPNQRVVDAIVSRDRNRQPASGLVQREDARRLILDGGCSKRGGTVTREDQYFHRTGGDAVRHNEVDLAKAARIVPDVEQRHG